MSFLNISPLKFNESIANKVMDICLPLFDSFGLTTFAYLKFLENGQLMHVCTNQEWLNFYVENNLFNDVNRYKTEINSIPKNGIGYFLRSSKVPNKFNPMLEKFGLWHGISIYIRYDKYAESWCFATYANNHQITDFYLKHMDILKHFILYFKSRAHDILDHSDSNKLLSTSSSPFLLSKTQLSNEKITNFLDKTKVSKHSFMISDLKLNLSRRQIQCLLYLSYGKSIKEIAHYFNISPRTVESYINSLKLKTGCHTKSELVKYFSNSPDFSLLQNFI